MRETLTVNANDNGNTGSGGAQDDEETVSITVNAVNDPPALTGDLAATVAEEGNYTLAAADLDYTDPDDGDSDVTFTVSSLTSTLDIEVSGVSSTTFTAADIATSNVVLVHDGSEPAAASFDVNVEDGNEDGSAPTDSGFTVTVTAVNDAPVVSVPAAQSVDEDATLNITGVSVADVDAAGGISPEVTVSLSVTNGALTVAEGSGATVTNNGTASVTVKGTLVDVNTEIGSIDYTGDADFNGAETLTVNANDNGNTGSGGAQDDEETVSITVNAVNDPPVLTGDLAATVAEEGNYTLAAADLDYTDPDDGDSDVTFTVSNLTSTLDIEVSSVSSTTFTAADIAASNVVLVHDGSEPAAASFDVNVEDGNEDGSAPTDSGFTVTVTAVNDAPVVSVPAAQSVDEDATLNITGVSVADVDAAGGISPEVTVSLSVTNGALTVAEGSGATVTNNGTASVTVKGTLADVNTEIGSIDYTGDTDFNGAETLTVNANDNGNTGGGALDDEETVSITVNAVNDPPALTGDLAATVAEEGNYTLTAADLDYTDPDDGDSDVTFTVSNLTSTLDIEVSGVQQHDVHGGGYRGEQRGAGA
ncbi:MAG: cadherin-like domain-containing protein [Gammaproteobacteria bacterium]|nr:cadherin-like domain-containing protein [Gammaproteobacteria bacterium]